MNTDYVAIEAQTTVCWKCMEREVPNPQPVVETITLDGQRMLCCAAHAGEMEARAQSLADSAGLTWSVTR